VSFSPTRKLTFAKATAGKQGEAGGIPPEPPFRPPRPEAEAKRQTAKEPEKNVGSNFILAGSGLFFFLLFLLLFVTIYLYRIIAKQFNVSKLWKIIKEIN
jgi:hypothetical protein